MKRAKKEKPISDELIDELLKQGRTAEDVNGPLKQLTKAVLERAGITVARCAVPDGIHDRCHP